MRIDADNIFDLSEIKPDVPTPYYNPAADPPRPSPGPQTQQPFIDPAILSLGPQPAPVSSGSVELHGVAKTDAETREHSASAQIPILSEAFSHLGTGDGSAKEIAKPSYRYTEGDSSNKPRGRRQSKQAKALQSDGNAAPDVPNFPGGNLPSGSRGKGWRQTPMLQQSTASFQPFQTLRKKGRGRKGTLDDGLESAEVTEEMGEFDFENNLAKFDKRTIFDQMRREDGVDDASRLVSHNRRPRPLTNGGKNLHPLENVLDMPSAMAKNADFWNSEADDGIDATERLSGKEARAPSNMLRAESKGGMSRRSQSRKASSAIPGGQPLSRVNSGVSIIALGFHGLA